MPAELDKLIKSQFIGKTLREVKEFWGPDVRVTDVGPVRMIGTRDYRTDRLNVSIDPKTVRIITKVYEMRNGQTSEYQEVIKEDLDNGIVVDVHLG